MAENKKNTDEFTDFGFERVPRTDKKHRVSGVFDSVADRYDLMNDLMSLGLHRACAPISGCLKRESSVDVSCTDFRAGRRLAALKQGACGY